MRACCFSLSLFDHLPAPGGPEVYEEQTPACPPPPWDGHLQGTAISHPRWQPGVSPAPTCFWGPAALSAFTPEDPAPSLAFWGLSFLAEGRLTTRAMVPLAAHGVLCPKSCHWHLGTEHRWCQHAWQGIPVLWDGAHYTLPSSQISLPLTSLLLWVYHRKEGSEGTSSSKYRKRHGHF